jgi:3,4-dihydroxy-9,10-secoandrosta-1,3,5(10)-triene-9,17-dione 4,5-dioxygenase
MIDLSGAGLPTFEWGEIFHVGIRVADLEAATLDDVGLALDRAGKHGLPLMHSLGKHTNDEMVSFYVYSPERYAIEFGCGGLLVRGEQPTYEITAGAYWGHKFFPPPKPAAGQ